MAEREGSKPEEEQVVAPDRATNSEMDKDEPRVAGPTEEQRRMEKLRAEVTWSGAPEAGL